LIKKSITLIIGAVFVLSEISLFLTKEIYKKIKLSVATSN
jgi:hypothetical protein